MLDCSWLRVRLGVTQCSEHTASDAVMIFTQLRANFSFLILIARGAADLLSVHDGAEDAGDELLRVLPLPEHIHGVGHNNRHLQIK